MRIGARQVATSSVVLLLENLVRLTMVAAVSFWIARELGPGQFGILNFASAFMAILLSIAALGMETPLILRLTQTRQPGALMGTSLLIRGVFSIAILGVAVLLALLIKSDDALSLNVTLVVGLCIIGYIPSLLDCWFKAKTSAVEPALARTAATLLSTCAKIACLLLGLGVVALAWTVVLESALAGLGLVLAYRWFARGSQQDALSVNRQLIVPLLRDSAPYLWSSVATLLFMKVDVVMLGYLSTNAETGIYSLAQKLSEVLYVVPVVLIDSAYPALARRFLDSEQMDSKHGQMLFDLAVGGSLVATLVALALAAPVINVVFGEHYAPSVQIFYLHAWSCVAIAMNTARHRWLAAVALQRYAPIVTGIGLIVNIAMNLALIPSMGALGAAIATVVSYFLSGYLTSIWLAPLREIGWMQTRALWPWSRLYTGLQVWRAR
jgi:PST family polysaccharide transporter